MSSIFNKAREAITGAGKQVFESPLREIQGVMPLIERAGFALRSIELELGLTPKISVSIDRSTGSVEDLQALMERGDLSSTQKALVSGIQTAFSIESMALRNSFRMGGLKIGVGIPPSVSIFLVPMDEAHDHMHRPAHGPESALEQPGVGPLPQLPARSISEALPIQNADSRRVSAPSSPPPSGPTYAQLASQIPELQTTHNRSPFLVGCLFMIVGLALAIWLLLTL